MDKIVNRKPPAVRQGRLSWRFSRFILPRLGWLNATRGWLTVWDSFGTPGDTLSTATICREIRRRHPRLRINCITPNPDLLKLDPAINRLNGPAGLAVLRFWYLDLIRQKDGRTNLLAPTLLQAGIRDFDYRARFYLSPEEKAAGKQRLAHLTKPIVTLNVQSREKVKMWFDSRWAAVVQALIPDCDIVQLGTDDEPIFPGVTRLAGQLNMRESAAVLAQARLHLGGVSFLMHVANGLDVPAVIVYGGRETPANSGYRENTNLYVATACSPCWLHDSHGDVCPFDMECMKRITVDDVVVASRRLLTEKSA